jgi:serine/threonine/tyrosine protein kinase RAD53
VGYLLRLNYIISLTRQTAELETADLARMLCEAIAYLHDMGIAHRDLKPVCLESLVPLLFASVLTIRCHQENILLTRGKSPIVKVSDFGLSKMVDENTLLRTMCGTPSYLAPEVVLQVIIYWFGNTALVSDPPSF